MGELFCACIMRVLCFGENTWLVNERTVGPDARGDTGTGAWSQEYSPHSVLRRNVFGRRDYGQDGIPEKEGSSSCPDSLHAPAGHSPSDIQHGKEGHEYHDAHY